MLRLRFEGGDNMKLEIKVFEKLDDVLLALEKNNAVFVYDSATPERVENVRSLSVDELLNMFERVTYNEFVNKSHESYFFAFEEISSS
jgi:hypothetical protein